MSEKNLVIVESPAKAKTINKYLGKDFIVLASFGHVRDLLPKDGSVRPDEGFAMTWVQDSRSSKAVKAITDAVKRVDNVYLATDPDREGEAISWHVLEILKEKKLLKNKQIERIAFNEITKTAVRDALANPRKLDEDLVEAYLARRALDYLVGFNLSPVLWRKLPGSKSAGRVQSVALRLICERESEIEVFKPQEYWSIEADVQNTEKLDFISRLYALDGKKLQKMSLGNKADTMAAVNRIKDAGFHVSQVKKKEMSRNPYPPFITSSLQITASRQLGFSATRTMVVAQKLYEGFEIEGETVGLITYMRTDGVTLSKDAIDDARKLIKKDYGTTYLPSKPRIYKSKAKNAQEAHEAIRPTNLSYTPKMLADKLPSDEYKLYDLIWRRTMASQMENAIFDQVSVTLSSGSGDIELRANGSTLKFDGHLRLTHDNKDEKDRLLPIVEEGDKITLKDVRPEQHFTQPPPRYSEASLVKSLEDHGIGRPSTYASIMQVLRDRDYVHMEKRRFIPEDRGRIVTTFLEEFFTQYVEYNFTAALEENLDKISAGNKNWQDILGQFWSEFSTAIDGTKDLTITEVIDALNECLAVHFFPPREDGSDPKSCPLCKKGEIGLKLGRHGAFIGCSRYPDCSYTRPLASSEDGNEEEEYPKILGKDKATGQDICIRKGPYGLYVQLDPLPPTEEELKAAEALAEEEKAKEAEKIAKAKAAGKKPPRKKKAKKAKGPKPKRSSIPKFMKPEEVDLEIAEALLKLPREIGIHPETGDKISTSIGPYGPYLKHGKAFVSLPNDDTVLTIGLDHAVTFIAENAKKGKAKSSGREIGLHPDDEKPITVRDGRYGPYVKHGKINASLTKSDEPDSITLERALELLAARLEKMAAKKKKAPAKKKKATPKKKKATTKKKTPAKKKTTTKTKKKESSK